MRRVLVFIFSVLFLGVIIYFLIPKEGKFIKWSSDIANLPADGVSSTLVKGEVYDKNGRKVWLEGGSKILLMIEPKVSFSIIGEKKKKTNFGEIKFKIRVGANPCSAKVYSSGNLISDTIYLVSTPVLSDNDKDGFPDCVELTSFSDRRNFREWFTSIADGQYYHQSILWSEVERDCAGLIRFAYREALKKHTSEWLSNFKFLTNHGIPDVEKYNYPFIPVIRTNIFRSKAGSFSENENIDSVFSAFVEAKYIMSYNCVYLGYDENILEKGDILFFFHYDDPQMPYHGMIFVGDDNGVLEQDNDDWLVYHTGPVNGTRGVVKKVRLSTLKQHPEEKWRPVSQNKYFLGYYRLKILE